MRAAHAARKKAEPRPAAAAGCARRRSARTSTRKPGFWLIPLPTIDPFVVRRSAAALERYGPDFSYAHYAGVKRLPWPSAGSAPSAR